MKHAQHRIIFGLQSPGSELYIAGCRQTYISISSNKQGLYSKELLASLPECLSAPSAPAPGVLTGTTSPTPTHSGSNSSGVATTPGAQRLRGSAASSGETQEICVVFQTNPTETRITTMLSQSVACQNLPGAKWLCSCTLKSLPEVHARQTHLLPEEQSQPTKI